MNSRKKTKTSNQTGFSAVEALLILVIVGMIGGTGYYVWHATQNSDKLLSANSDSTTVTHKKKAAVDETASWYLYKAPSGNYKLRLPDGWKLERYQEDDFIYGAEASNTTYKKGTLATVGRIDVGKDFGSLVFYLNYGNDFKLSSGAVQQPGFKTAQGLEVKKYRSTVDKPVEGIGPPQGTVTYQYVIAKGDKTAGVSHDITPGDTDKTAIIEQALKTLELR